MFNFCEKSTDRFCPEPFKCFPCILNNSPGFILPISWCFILPDVQTAHLFVWNDSIHWEQRYRLDQCNHFDKQKLSYMVMELYDCKLHLCLLGKYANHTQLSHCSSQLSMPGVGLDTHVDALVIIILWEVYWTNKVAFLVGKCFLVFILTYICQIKLFVNKYK